MSSDKKTKEQAIEELTLMLLYLTRFQDNNEFCRYLEPSWKSYEFDVLNMLEKKDMLFQPDNGKQVYLSEEGKEFARKLLNGYRLSDTELLEKYEFRSIHQDEADQAVYIEHTCFPPHEACSEKCLKERIEKAPDLFLVAVNRATGRLAGFLNGISTNEYSFQDKFFLDAGLHIPEGKVIMLLGLDVLPEYRKQGLGRELVFQYLRRERDRGRGMLILTCLHNKVKMYQKMGFADRGIADSTWGGEEWHEMAYSI